MILVIVSRKDCVHLLESEGIDHKGNVSQVRLHRASAAHVGHLVSDCHLAVAVGPLSVSAPQVDGDVRAARGLEPDAGASKPPHRDLSLRNDFILNVFHQPGAPFRESSLDPALSGHLGNFAHINLLLLIMICYVSFSAALTHFRFRSGSASGFCSHFNSEANVTQFIYVRFNVCFLIPLIFMSFTQKLSFVFVDFFSVLYVCFP